MKPTNPSKEIENILYTAGVRPVQLREMVTEQLLSLISKVLDNFIEGEERKFHVKDDSYYFNLLKKEIIKSWRARKKELFK